MGYRPKRTVYVLQFEGDDFEGLEVKVRPPSVGEAMDHVDLSWIKDPTLPEAEQGRRLRGLYELFAGRLLEWNVEDPATGEPVPATLDGVLSLDHDFGIRLVESWLFRTAGVPAPLDADSNTGPATVDESLIPMTVDFAALAS